MAGDVGEEVGDNGENALDWGDGAAWWDSHCANAVPSDFVKGASQWGFICHLRKLCDYLGGDVGGSRGI
jgi:hypothetical protein